MQVQKLRLQRGWSQQQLADASGLSARTIQRLEAGHPPSLETLKCLAAVFGIDLETLGQGSEMTTPTTNQVTSVTADEQEAFHHAKRLRQFWLHLMQYVVVSLVLGAINLIFDPTHLWFIGVPIFWTIGVIVHALYVFVFAGVLDGQWERKVVERRLGRPL
jgi:transcriptional regulator with XRE-family HTH domain